MAEPMRFELADYVLSVLDEGQWGDFVRVPKQKMRAIFSALRAAEAEYNGIREMRDSYARLSREWQDRATGYRDQIECLMKEKRESEAEIAGLKEQVANLEQRKEFYCGQALKAEAAPAPKETG